MLAVKSIFGDLKALFLSGLIPGKNTDSCGELIEIGLMEEIFRKITVNICAIVQSK